MDQLIQNLIENNEFLVSYDPIQSNKFFVFMINGIYGYVKHENFVKMSIVWFDGLLNEYFKMTMKEIDKFRINFIELITDYYNQIFKNEIINVVDDMSVKWIDVIHYLTFGSC